MSNHSTSERSLPETEDTAEVRLDAVQVSEPGAELVFPAEDQGQSLAEMAQRDLDAALQLLADRAQYITGASGAAIALRHEGEHDMLCRASAGTNAPELGALLSAEFGLSGESVRTQQALCCDDAEHDGRVNRESCRELGIASVAVVPVVSDDEVLGVFELFSGKPFAFGERDLAALQRLAEMVETAARIARAAGVPGLAGDAARLELQARGDFGVEPGRDELEEPESLGEGLTARVEETLSSSLSSSLSLVAGAAEPPPAELAPSEQMPVFKPLLWSANEAGKDADDKGNGESILDDGSLPLALRELRKCEACGFPVSEGRRLCLDCDEKNWRGRGRASGDAGRDAARFAAPVVAGVPAASVAERESAIIARDLGNASLRVNAPEQIAADDVPILSAALESSPSWWAANKFAVAAVVVVALAIGAVMLLR